MILNEGLAFYSALLDIHQSGVLQYSAVWLLRDWCHMSRHFMQSYGHRVRACSAVTCHLPYWQNDRNLLRATAVTPGGGGGGGGRGGGGVGAVTEIRVSTES